MEIQETVMDLGLYYTLHVKVYQKKHHSGQLIINLRKSHLTKELLIQSSLTKVFL